MTYNINGTQVTFSLNYNNTKEVRQDFYNTIVEISDDIVNNHILKKLNGHEHYRYIVYILDSWEGYINAFVDPYSDEYESDEHERRLNKYFFEIVYALMDKKPKKIVSNDEGRLFEEDFDFETYTFQSGLHETVTEYLAEDIISYSYQYFRVIESATDITKENAQDILFAIIGIKKHLESRYKELIKRIDTDYSIYFDKEYVDKQVKRLEKLEVMHMIY